MDILPIDIQQGADEPQFTIKQEDEGLLIEFTTPTDVTGLAIQTASGNAVNLKITSVSDEPAEISVRNNLVCFI